jgi:type VI secretion system protein ImpJ
MSWTAKTIWSEGMFLRPQHFQQHDRYLEALIEDRCSPLRPYAWGVRELEINEEALGLGKVDIARCRAVLPDGTTINIPSSDTAPEALELDNNTRDQTVYICLLGRRYGSNEVSREDGEDLGTRLSVNVMDVRDTSVPMDTSAPIELGRKNLRLLRENDERADYACLGAVRVVEVRNDNTVILDRIFIPPALDCRDTPRLSGYIKDLLGLLKQRGEKLAARVGAAHGGTADTSDFMLLQVINRYEPLFHHLATLPDFHPESLYAICTQMAGELSTFTSLSKRPSEYPVYDHEDLAGCFEPLMAELREALTKIMVETAISIELIRKRGDVYKADVPDRALFDDAYWVLAIKADMPAEEIRTLLPQQAKIGTTDQIANLVKLQIPGVAMSTLPQAPREIPFHAGFQYFELDRRGDMWKQIRESGAMALHAGGNFPGIQFELWAIRIRA